MKLNEEQKYHIRLGLWVASLVWGAFFLIYGLMLMPAFLEIVSFYYPGGGFPKWITGIFYTISILTVVMIFFWFFNRLFGKKKREEDEEK